MKLGRTTKIRQNFFFHHHSPFSSFRTTKIRQNFFVPSAHSTILDTRLSSWFNPSHPYPHRSRLSYLLAQSIIFGSTRHPRFIRLRSYALRVLFVPSIHPSISSCCFDLSSTTVSLFVLGPLGCAVYPMLTVGLTCTQLSRPFYSGCATYPMLVVGVTCTLSSRSRSE